MSEILKLKSLEFGKFKFIVDFVKVEVFKVKVVGGEFLKFRSFFNVLFEVFKLKGLGFSK